MSRELVDLDRLPKKMRDRLSSALSPEEKLVVSIKGIGGALLATDRQILLWQRNTLTSYPLKSVSGIEWNLGGFNKWLRIAGDGLEEERPTFRNLPTRKHALGIGQTPKEQRDALSQLVGTSAPPAVVASVDAYAPHLDVMPLQQQPPIEQQPTAGSDSVLEKDSVNDRGALPGHATGQGGGWKAQIATRVEPGPITPDPLATGPKDLAEYEAYRQAKLTKRPGVRQVFMASFRAGQGKGPPPPSFRQDWAATSKALRDRRAARKSERVRLAQEATLARLARAAAPKTSAKVKISSTRKSGKGPLAIALIAGAAFLFLRANPAPATPATQATVAPAGPSWTEYQARTATWSSALAVDSSALTSDARSYDATAMYVDASLMQSDAQSYGTWLEAHGSSPCYKNVWSLSVSASVHYSEAGFYAARWSDAAPNGNPADLSTATSDMTQASSEVDQLTSELKNVSCP
jgi:hypothetical protein